MTVEFGMERTSTEYTDDQTGNEEDGDLGVSEPVCPAMAID